MSCAKIPSCHLRAYRVNSSCQLRAYSTNSFHHIPLLYEGHLIEKFYTNITENKAFITQDNKGKSGYICENIKIQFRFI